MGLIQRIRERAREIYRRLGPGMFDGLDPVLVRKAVDEIRKATARHGSVDGLARKVMHESQEKNEAVGSTILLSVLGLHYTIKLLKAIKDREGLMSGLLSLPIGGLEGIRHGETHPTRTGRKSGSGIAFALKFAGHLVVHIILLLYLLLFIANSAVRWDKPMRDSSGRLVNAYYKWDGVHNYQMWDGKGNRYDVVWTGGNRYDVLLDGRKVMDCVEEDDKWNLIGLDGKLRYREVSIRHKGGVRVDGRITDKVPTGHDVDLVREMDLGRKMDVTGTVKEGAGISMHKRRIQRFKDFWS